MWWRMERKEKEEIRRDRARERGKERGENKNKEERNIRVKREERGERNLGQER